MVIISDCVKDKLDEGCIKVASVLTRHLVERGSKLLAVNCACSYADLCVTANKFYSNKEIYTYISKQEGDILYIPFASNTLGSAIRTWVLAHKSGRKVNVLFALRWEMSKLTKFILRLSGCNVCTISQESYGAFYKELKGLEVKNIKVGVDTTRFCPVDNDRKLELRKKYNLPLDKKIILHVGHLKHERNIDVFLKLDDCYHGVLVFSSVTEQDEELKQALLTKPNITVINDYCKHIEEIYQASDIYLFPVVKEFNCIDVPLSVLEAAACNINVITTKYKEIGYFDAKPGLNLVDGTQLDDLNHVISEVDGISEIQTREIALSYDWNNAADVI